LFKTSEYNVYNNVLLNGDNIVSDLFNKRKFDESVTDEILALKNRVRNLIGDSHWQKEGEYKEALLRKIINRILPSKYTIGTGFILGKSIKPSIKLKQIDILIFDSMNYPPLLNENDFFYIVEPESVRAIIEVKTKLESTKLINTIIRMNEIGEFIYENSNDNLKDLFVGIFSFDGNEFEDFNEDSISNFKKKISIQLDNKKLLNNIHKSYRGDGHTNFIVLNKDIIILRQFANYTYQVKLDNNLVYSDFVNYLKTFLFNYDRGGYENRKQYDCGKTLFEIKMDI